MDTSLERFSYDLDKKRANKTEIERFDWFIERIQTRVAFGGLFLKLHARELDKVSFYPYNFRITKLSARKSEQMKSF